MRSMGSTEQLMPPIGTENLSLKQEKGRQASALVSTDIEPLFEIDGVKALAQIQISHNSDTPEDTYYVVDVNGLGYSRKGESGIVAVDYLVVSSDYFSSPTAKANPNNFASLRYDANKQENTATIIGGHYDRTRFNRQGTENSFSVGLTGGEKPSAIRVEMPYHQNGEVKVAYRRDESDPVNYVLNQRERRASGKSDATTGFERGDKREKSRNKYIKTLLGHFKRQPNADFNYGDEDMKYSPSRGHYKEVYDEVNKGVLEEVDELAGFQPFNEKEVGDALYQIEANEHDEVVEAVSNELQKTKIRSLLGSVGTLAAGVAVSYLDVKFGGIVEKGKDAPLNIVTVAEGIALGALPYVQFKTWDKFSKVHLMLKNGIDKKFPKPSTNVLAIATDEKALIRQIAHTHEEYLLAMDRAVYDLRAKL